MSLSVVAEPSAKSTDLPPIRIPVLGHIARAVGQEIDLVFYLLVIALTALVLAVMIYGLPALVLTALALVPVMFLWFIIISLP